MEVDEPSTVKNEDADLIEIIPYLFQILDMLEVSYLAEMSAGSKSTSPSSESAASGEHQLTGVDCLQLESMCLNALLAIYRLNKTFNKQRLESAKFNIELLMQILQTKPDGELDDDDETTVSAALSDTRLDRLNVQQNILILLSEIASIFPDKVLEHVLIMFVFVGNKLTRKDDSYSFQIINQIIKSILPAIVASCIEEQQQHQQQVSTSSSSRRLASTVNTMQRHQKQLPYVSSLVCKILQSFVVALPHIPAHRKTVIFQNLMNIIGLNDYLWITLIQALDHYLVQSQDLLAFKQSLEEFKNKQKELLLANGAAASEVAVNEKKLRATLMQCMESMIALHVQFQPSHVIQASIYLVTFLNKYLGKLFEKCKTAAESKATLTSGKPKLVYSHLACQLDYYNQHQMKYLSYSMLTFVIESLNSPELIAKLAEVYETDGAAETYARMFETLIERILMLVLHLTEEAESATSDTNAGMKKFEKTLLGKSFELLERTIQLLDSKQFIDVVRRLVRHELTQLRRRALGLLNAKLRKYEPSDAEVSLHITLVDDLLDTIQVHHTPSSSADVEVNNQTVLFCLKLLCKRIGERNPLAFVKVVKYLSENLLDKTLYMRPEAKSIDNVNLLSVVLLCCGELCLKLKSNALVYLNQIVSFDLDVIDFVRGKLESAVQLKPSDEDELTDEFEEARGKREVEKEANARFLKKFKTYELLMLSCATCLQKILANMSNFVSPFLARLIYVSCSLSYLTAVNQRNRSQHTADSEQMLVDTVPAKQQLGTTSLAQLDAKLALLRSTLATQIPLRLLAPILSQQSIGMSDDAGSSQTADAEFKMRLKYVEFYMQIVRYI